MATYKDAGVDIDSADAAKKEMAKSIESAAKDKRILNRPGAFASLFEAKFEGISDPILVLKAEEPGSKQLLAIQHGRIRDICFDLINHLIDDILVMGAMPLAVLDTIVCGALDKKLVVQFVSGIAEACAQNMCSLVGGETSEQPGVLASGRYVLCATVVGVVDRSKIVDGSKIKAGDKVLALPSNGPHTNGYTLIRKLLEQDPSLAASRVGSETFIDAVMRPHTSYISYLKPLLAKYDIHGLAHITGGGVRDNLARVLPKSVDAHIQLGKLRIPPVFAAIRKAGNVPDDDMLRTYNLGVGITLVAEPAECALIIRELGAAGLPAYEIGEIIAGAGTVQFSGTLGF